MTDREMRRIAMEQSAEDIGCKAEDFTKTENVICAYHMGNNARKYLKKPVIGNFVSYGSNVVAAVQDDIRDIAEEYLKKFEYYHLFETPNMNWLSEKIAPMGYGICFMAEYYLPKTEMLSGLACDYELKVLEKGEFEDLYLKEWSNALCYDRKHLDMLAVGAYDGDQLVGLAGCSADAAEMWQIGVDVLPEFRRKGVAAAITSKLALEITERGKVPFYCTAWSNIRSVRNAIKSGLIPAWAEMTVKPVDSVNEINLQ